MSGQETIQLTRIELYQRVWEKPMRDLSSELGMSDVGLKKLCRRNGIPTPPPGYHLMKEGLKKRRAHRSLPTAEIGQQTEFTFQKNMMVSPEQVSVCEKSWLDLVEHPPSELTNQDVKKIKSLIQTLRKTLDKRKVDERGILLTPGKEYPIRVSPTKLDEAVEYFNRLFQRMVELGATLPEYEKENYRSGLKIKWQNFVFYFRVEEASNRFEIPPDKRPKREYSWYRDEYEYKPTGFMRLEVWGPGYGGMGMSDGKRRQLIERIDEIAKRMFFRAYEQTEKDRIEAIRTEKAIKYLQKKDEIRRAKEFELLKQKKLLKEAREWRRIVEIRAYIEAIESMGPDASSRVFEAKEDWSNWVNWAKKYVDSLDFTKQGLAGDAPPYPEAKTIDSVPLYFLKYDDPEEADKNAKGRYWWEL